jgi:hypothetical protein
VFGFGGGRAPGVGGRCQAELFTYFVGTKAQFLAQNVRAMFQRVGPILSTQFQCP